MPPKKTATTMSKPAKATAAAKKPVGKQAAGVKKATAAKAAPTKTPATAIKKDSSSKKAVAVPDEAAAKPTPAEKAAATRKRKAEEAAENDETRANTSKRRKSSEHSLSPAPAENRVIPGAKKLKVAKAKAVINHAPTQRLDVYVSGEGSQGELGLGAGKGSTNALKPRLNTQLSAADVGVVQLATGGMHCAALTHDNKILTWGVNDEGALGRDTQWDGGMVDVDDNKSDDSSDDAELNPREATPTAVESSEFPEETAFVQVAAGDSTTFALTDEGLVYGWGTFRGNDGILGFSPTAMIQRRPALIEGLKKVTQLAAGANHCLALCSNGAVFAWGAGQQHQLGRRIVQRSKLNGLVPREFGLPKAMVNLAAGDTHSFAVHRNGKVYTWGLNNYGQTGIAEGAGGDEAVVLHPTIVDSLDKKGNITCIDGGQFHSIAVTEDGKCLSWGRIDGFQTGIQVDTLAEEHVVRDGRGRPKILTTPTQVPSLDAVWGAAGTDYSIAVTRDGKAYSWGFGDGYRTGQGTDDDIEVARVMNGKAIANKKIVWAGAGGQFGVLAGKAAPLVNGVAH